MSDRRLDPDQLRARLQANLEAAVPRGQALPGAFESALADARWESRLDDGTSRETDATSPESERFSHSSDGPVDASVAEPDVPATGADVHRSAGSGQRAATKAPSAVKRGSAVKKPSPVKEGTGSRRVVHRCDGGAVLRGYRIPLDLHRRAERAKLRASASRGATLFWDEILQSAIDALPDDVGEIADGMARSGAGRAEPNPTTRVLQATIRHDQELRLRTMRLDLEELLDRTVRLEEIWSWMVREVVDGGLVLH